MIDISHINPGDRVKVGQVWRDKDKRRNTVIEIIRLGEPGGYVPEGSAVGVVIGTETCTTIKIERLAKRWELVKSINLPKTKKKVEPKPEPLYSTREAWLLAAVGMLSERVFAPHDLVVPEVRVSVGWPGGRGKKEGVVGQCFATKVADDKVAQIFISPVVGTAYEAVETLAHELVHAIDDCEAGHKGNFIRIAGQIGFTKPWKITPASDELKAEIESIVEQLGIYPHSKINPTKRPTVQKTYMIKLESQDCDTCGHSGYLVRMTQKWIDEVGLPMCPHGIELVEA